MGTRALFPNPDCTAEVNRSPSRPAPEGSDGCRAGGGGLPRLSIVQNVAQGRGSTAGGQARLWKVLPRQELEQSRAESLQAV